MKDLKLHSALKELLKEKSRMCVSLIIPLHKNPSFQKSDKIIIDHAVKKLHAALDSQYKPALVNTFINKIKALQGKMNLNNGMEGVGIFISPKILKVVQFPFEVEEKIIVADTFELRDVLYKEFYLKDYFVLSLTTNMAHLLKGNGNIFKEIKNKDFPATFTDDYEYSKPSRGNSYGNTLKQFEKDKSIVKEQRAESFYHEIDKKLNKYLKTDIPLVVAGVKKDIGYFEKETTNAGSISGKVFGSFDGYNSAELREHAWDKIKEHFLKEEKKTISELNELIGKKLVTTGVQNVWRDAKAGKGNILVVEKDLKKTAFLGEDGSKLLMRPPKGDHKIINDAVDDIIEMVTKKSGKIVFVSNGSLKDLEGIALINRYQ